MTTSLTPDTRAVRAGLENCEVTGAVVPPLHLSSTYALAAVLRQGGRLVSVAEEPPADAAAGRKIVARYFLVEPNREQLLEIATLADSGELRPVVGEVFDLADARSAFARSMSRDKHGKVVLRKEAWR